MSRVGPYADSTYPQIDLGGKYLLWQSAGAYVRFKTSATQVTLTSWNNIDSTYTTFAEIGVRADGSDVGVAELSAEGEIETVVNLPAGADKTVDLIVGLQSMSSGLLGTWLVDAQFNAAASVQSPVTAPRLLIYGDSITVGGNAANPSLEGWTQLVRNAYSGSLVCDAWGVRSLYDDASTEAKRARLVAAWVQLSPAVIWLAIGTNDYGLNKWAAADFGAAYADTLDKLHVALPAAVIYVQTPLVRSSEVANGSGSTLGDYRDQIATAQSTRSEWCTLVDGTAILTTDDLAEGVHPTTTGHAIYAAYVKTVLGLT